MSEEGKGRGVTGDQQNQLHYGTFQGVANYYPPAPQPQPQPQPVVGFPQPVPPPGYHHHLPYGYQTGQVVQGYAVVEGTPIRETRLPCCGIGMGWFLEKPGYIACTIASTLAVIVVMLGVTRRVHGHDWSAMGHHYFYVYYDGEQYFHELHGLSYKVSDLYVTVEAFGFHAGASSQHGSGMEEPHRSLSLDMHPSFADATPLPDNTQPCNAVDDLDNTEVLGATQTHDVGGSTHAYEHFQAYMDGGLDIDVSRDVYEEFINTDGPVDEAEVLDGTQIENNEEDSPSTVSIPEWFTSNTWDNINDPSPALVETQSSLLNIGGEAHTHSVSLVDKTRACEKWEANKIPCSHLIAVCAKYNHDATEFMDRFYRVEERYHSYEPIFQSLKDSYDSEEKTLWRTRTMTSQRRRDNGDGPVDLTTHFPHFFKIIMPQTLAEGKLRIPKKFISESGVDLANLAFLMIPNGTKWTVKLTKCDGEVCFQNGSAHGVGRNQVGCKSSPLVKVESDCNLDESFSHDQCPNKDGGVAENDLVRANALKSENPLFTVIIHPSYINGKDRASLPNSIINYLPREGFTKDYTKGSTLIVKLEVVDWFWPVKLYIYEEKYSSCVVFVVLMHELLHWVPSCAALSVAAESASPSALAAALGGMLCCTGVAAGDGALATALGGMLCCTSVAAGDAFSCFS
nr:60s ribosomal protein l18a-like protein [Quercus suber]